MNNPATRGFYRICLSTLVAVYILIGVGGIVRSTGSGMGCPDWPKCFGQWIPPTSVDELPDDYKQTYSAYRDKKNQKFARYLKAVGMEATAEQILSDESILMENDFNAARTWTEYVNRLTGVIVGLFIIGLFVRSFPFRKSQPVLFWLSFATLVTVIIQGWFGSIVVSTNLTTWTITIHMFIALLIVVMLVLLLVEADPGKAYVNMSPRVRWLLGACAATLLIQVFLGTNVREAIDQVAQMDVQRSQWITLTGVTFIVHRTFSWAVLILHVALIVKLKKTSGVNILPRVLILLILGTLLTGAGMAYFSIPAFLQPMHLVLATTTFGLQVYLLTGSNLKAFATN